MGPPYRTHTEQRIAPRAHTAHSIPRGMCGNRSTIQSHPHLALLTVNLPKRINPDLRSLRRPYPRR